MVAGMVLRRHHRLATLVLSAFASFVASPHTAFAAENEQRQTAQQQHPDETRLRVADVTKAFRQRGFDLLIADAHVRGVEGDLLAARAVSNPIVSPVIGQTFGYNPPSTSCNGCSSVTFGIGVTDASALSDAMWGKRALRSRIAEHALRSAKLARKDAEQQILADVRAQLVTLAGAEAHLDAARSVRDSLSETVELSRKRYPGTIDEGQLARVEREKLEADNAVDRRAADLREASLALAYLLGERTSDEALAGAQANYRAASDVLPFRVPERLASVRAPADLTRRALQVRSSVQQSGAEVDRSLAAIELALRERLPTIGFTLGYTQTGTGTNAIQPPTATLGLSIPLPVFYQQQGEVGRARADRDAAMIDQERIRSRVMLEVLTSFSEFQAYRSIVERTQGAVLERARVAREIVEKQYRSGATTLIDYLDAQRAYTETNNMFIDSLIAYWTSVYRLEAAVGEELT